MLDDDAIIRCTDTNAAQEYMKRIDEHPKGFCFIHSQSHVAYGAPYKAAQLNLCAISRYIYSREPLINVDPQKNEAFEDFIYSN